MISERLSVSICIATYNGANSIRQQIETILPQLLDQDEIIISDDHSKDKTVEILESFNDSRIKIFTNKKKSGPVGNFENSISLAGGEIIFLCDQDDLWFENKVESHLKYHKSHDLVVSDAVVIDQEKKILFSSFFKQRGSKKGLISNLIRNSYIGCCMSFTRKLAEKSLPFPGNIHMHDWWIGIVAELYGKIYFLNEPLMYYIRHSENASDTLIKTLPVVTQIKNRMQLINAMVSMIFLKK